eukprot:6904032-Prymnesium_polylepis.2
MSSRQIPLWRQLVQPSSVALLPSDKLLACEPERNLTRGALGIAAAVYQVATPVHAIVATDGARRALERFGRADHGTDRRDDAARLPDGGDDRARGQVAACTIEEVAPSVLRVVLAR